jgi:hypothetical protein
MKLYICISTYKTRIYDLSKLFLPFREDVKYIVVHQIGINHVEKFNLDFLNRIDIEYYQLYNDGLSISRNFAIKKVPAGNVIWILDDDVEVLPNSFDQIFKSYKKYSDADFISFKIKSQKGEPKFKNYLNVAKKIKNINDYKGALPSSIEITFKSKLLHYDSILFDHRFGAGSFYIGGEENLFICEVLKKSLNVYFIPIFIVEHAYESTGKKFAMYSKERLRYLGAHYYIFRSLPSFIIFCISFFFKSRFVNKAGLSVVKCIFYSMHGFFYMVLTDILKFKRTRYS